MANYLLKHFVIISRKIVFAIFWLQIKYVNYWNLISDHYLICGRVLADGAMGRWIGISL